MEFLLVLPSNQNHHHMPLNKVYEKLDLKNLGRRKNVDFTNFLEANICEYIFSVVWSSGAGCNLNYLGGNRPPSTQWHPIITTPQSDDDGEITIRLGHFSPASVLNLSFGIQAVDPIARIALLVTNVTTRRVLKTPAGDAYKNLPRNGTWTEMITITLP